MRTRLRTVRTLCCLLGLVLTANLLTVAAADDVEAAAADVVGFLDPAEPDSPDIYRGWALDRLAPSLPVSVVLSTYSASGALLYRASQVGSTPRPDVAAVFGPAAATRGFQFVLPSVPGLRRVCVTVGGIALTDGCREPYTAPGNRSAAHLEKIGAPHPGLIQVRGWYFDTAGTGILPVAGTLDGARFNTDASSLPGQLRPPYVFVVRRARPDVDRYFGYRSPDGVFAGRGFEWLLVGIPPGRHRLCVSSGDPGGSVEQYIDLGCHQLDVPAPASGSPIGHLDAVVSRAETGSYDRISGWAHDPDGPTVVHVYREGLADSVPGELIDATSVGRPDVRGAVPLVPESVGFDALVGSAGSPFSCAFAINVGAGANTLLGCAARRGIADDGPVAFLAGFLDALESPAPGTVHLAGWAAVLIENDPDHSARVVLSIDNRPEAGLPAGSNNLPRPDVTMLRPELAPGFGFEATLAGIPAGRHQACVHLVHSATGVRRVLACRMLTVG